MVGVIYGSLIALSCLLGVVTFQLYNPPPGLHPLSQNEQNYRRQFWSGQFSTMVDMVKSGGFYIPKRFLEIQDEVRNLQIKRDDLFLLVYPKVGSTRAQEMLWQLSRGVDIKGGETPLAERFPFLELESLVPKAPGTPNNTVEAVKNFASPRQVKCNLIEPFLPKYLPGNAKIIYLTRNPKDVAVSYYFHEMLLQNHGFNSTFEQYAEFFLEGQVAYGSFWNHTGFGLELQRQFNDVLILTYEQMNKDIKSVMKTVISFMGYPYVSDEKLEILKDHLSFKSFQKNSAVNMEPDGGNQEDEGRGRFIRKGIIGDWKNFFSKELSDRFDAKTHQALGDTGFMFEYE
uniref:Sulfotransferase 1A3/1A4 n=1 Tax=Caligus clemensi TaxID=344056 RepID=C1BZX8_CALCM|nr:Sulfotransferase 1A3/1A4 [Caligus clemensi]